MNYSYFPGCSLKSTGIAYHTSFLAVCKKLGIVMEELPEWNCCGATMYMSVDEASARALSCKNLAMAEKLGRDLVAPCAACYGVLMKAEEYRWKYPSIGEAIDSGLKKIGLEFPGHVNVRHPLEILVFDYGLEKLKEQVVNPLQGLKVASYYGCRIVRPNALFDDQHNPMTMDNLMSASGADAVQFPLKTKCCGGSLAGTMPEAGLQLCWILMKEMKKRGAEVVVTACPLCQFNMEVYQDKIKAAFPDGKDVCMPILYFTQLIGLALGIDPKDLCLDRQIVPVLDLLKSKQLVGAGGR